MELADCGCVYHAEQGIPCIHDRELRVKKYIELHDKWVAGGKADESIEAQLNEIWAGLLPEERDAIPDLDDPFARYGDYGDFAKVKPKRSTRSDLHAMLLLNELVPGTGSIIAGAEHDVVYFSVTREQLLEKSNDAQREELFNCGMFWSEEYGLFIFV